MTSAAAHSLAMRVHPEGRFTLQKKTNRQEISIAIIGIGCFFPKSSGLKEYWRLLSLGQDGIADIPSSHWSPSDYFDPDPKAPDRVYCQRGGFLPPVSFDPTEWGIPPNAIEATDTSQLLALVAAKMALSDAGYGNDKPFDRERTSVILGVTGAQELVIPLGARLGFPKWRRALASAGLDTGTIEDIVDKISKEYVQWQENSFPGLLGNVVAGRISNRLNLSGTNCAVDAACASSMSAVHLAALELSTHRCDMVLTGGVDTFNDIFMHMCFAKTNILSPSGDAKPFSMDADGTVLGEGVGILVMKRLADAERDNDRIYAVIRGLGTASDGKSQSIYAPRSEGQAKALRKAYDSAGIDPATVRLIEAHGTGTRVGDAVEFDALKNVFYREGGAKQSIALGSVKSMIGHTKAAAGSAGLIKLALSLYHKVMPPTLKADRPDPKLAIGQSPFYLNTQVRPWLNDIDAPRRAGVSSFGFGGSNYHAVLEEYQPHKSEPSWNGSVDIFAFSASEPKGILDQLNELKKDFSDSLLTAHLRHLAARTRREFRPENPHRLLICAKADQFNAASMTELCERAKTHLQSGSPGEDPSVFIGNGPHTSKIAYVFPGQGSQYVGMGRDLVCCFPEALQALEKANAVFGGLSRISDVIYPPTVGDSNTENEQRHRLNRTDWAQPAIGAVSLAMYKVLQRFGVMPDVTCGHSFGELTALYAAGCYTEDTFLSVAIQRGRLMAEANTDQTGAMLAINAPLKEIGRFINEYSLDLVLANRNGPSQAVLSGAVETIAQAEKLCQKLNLRSFRLPVSAAFHSPLMTEAQIPFKRFLEQIRINPPQIPVFSNATGEPYPDNVSQVRDQLGEHLLRPVNFMTEVENLYTAGVHTFIEVGPKTVLTGLIQTILEGRRFSALALDQSRGHQNGLQDLALLLCRLAAAGYPVKLDRWEAFPSAPQIPKMQIAVSGANVWRPSSQETTKERPVVHRSSAPLKKPLPQDRQPQHRQSSGKITNGNHMTMKQNDPSQPSSVHDALTVIREGLKSIETLQQQTAETHQKFLDTQKEASRALQMMMKQTHQLMGSPVEDTHHGSTSTHTLPTIPDSGLAETPPSRLDDLSRKIPAPSNATPEFDPSHPTHVQPIPDQSDSNPGLSNTLLAVVSELTGYPVDMIDLDMDIEADLGIDSIKRVEILSTLEEKMLNLPAIPPEDLGSMKTLNQILAFISEKIGANESATINHAEPSSEPYPPINTPSSSTLDVDELKNRLLSVVSDLTGYPVEMIGVDMDIEADLGIDSIKRVEILSTLEEKYADLPPVSPETIGSLKTLAEIVQVLVNAGSESPPVDRTDHNHRDAADNIPTKHFIESADLSQIARQRVRLDEQPIPDAESISIATGSKIFITDDKTGLSKAIADELAHHQINTVLISPDILTYKNELPSAAGLLLVYGPETVTNREDLKTAFGLAKHVAPALQNAAKNGGAVFGAVLRLDGGFGFRTGVVADPLQGAIAGLIKTAALEWKGVSCRVIDVDPEWQDPFAIAKAVVAELRYSDPHGKIEVGLDAAKRHTLTLEPIPYPQEASIDLPFKSDEVVVVSGGARGITAAHIFALSQHCRPTFVLLGRTPAPRKEPTWLQGLQEKAAVKEAILRNEFGLPQPSPVQLEKAYRQHMANREVLRNLNDLEQNNITAHYYSVDIRDNARVKEILATVRRQFGSIRALIHGAGVIQDRLIEDKTVTQFETVFDTKVEGLQSLLHAMKEDALRFLILYSSVAARFGNRGQADYAMANEALNKIAWQESARRPACKVISLNWGPWDGGMISASLKRDFKRRGIDLIPLEVGSRCLAYEMAHTEDKTAEIIIGGALELPIPNGTEKAPAKKTTPLNLPGISLALSFQKEVDVENYPIVGHHQLNGKPVIPMALMTEWLGHGALHENPGLYLHGLDNMRVLQGIKIEKDKRLVRVMAGKAQKTDSGFKVDLELRDGHKGDIDIVHSKATAILTESVVPPPQHPPILPKRYMSYPRSIEDVYDKILFHGQLLHGIQRIDHLDETGMVALVSTAPPPSKWLKDPLRNTWITDPLIIDSAYQMASVWCYEHMGMVSLPSYCSTYRQYTRRFPPESVTVVLQIDQTSRNKMTGGFTFLDDNQTVLAQIKGYEAVVDQSLYRAFKPDLVVNA